MSVASLRAIAAKITSMTQASVSHRIAWLRNPWPSAPRAHHEETSSTVARRPGKPKGLRLTDPLASPADLLDKGHPRDGRPREEHIEHHEDPRNE